MKTKTWSLALHGGAGAVAGRNYSETEAHLGPLARECEAMLKNGSHALDVVEFAVAELESCGLYVAGRGSAPNTAGYVELDASIMDGTSREAGGVAGLCGFANPVRVARGVMERTPHVLLVGRGAANFAASHEFAAIDDPDTWFRLPVGVYENEINDMKHGTVGAVALDQNGALAAATSTGGTFGKLEGRVGDTPLIGPGTWADDEVAISFTGIGEHIMRSGGAIAVACAVKSGTTLDNAIQGVLDEIARLGGDAGVIAVSRNGAISMAYNSEGMKRAAVASNLPLQVATFETN
ncbi:MAG: isoaspartyl peptidase/L-asparaginase [Pseudomonadota bacterium]